MNYELVLYNKNTKERIIGSECDKFTMKINTYMKYQEPCVYISIDHKHVKNIDVGDNTIK